MISPYPALPAGRDRWILERRGPRNALDPRRPYAQLSEVEPDDAGEPVPVSTIFLTNRECPWHCLMCDLWRNTLVEAVAPGAIPEQIRFALSRLPAARWVKLYNAGSFFDPKAIPRADYAPVARLLSGFERVIVESHPSLVGESCFEFRDAVKGALEVAMGLETVHPKVLPLLNKGMTLEQFRRSADFLSREGISLRAFVLVGLPFSSEAESLLWACRSVEFAFDCGASVVSLIPTRAGNGALDALAERGEFSLPGLASVEDALAFGLSLRRGRVLADLWDLERLRRCAQCFGPRAERLRTMNLTQSVPPPAGCDSCARDA
ncbi:MAG TPA: radical SAM protein [Thermoanaerobaculia bacterium]|nr:radical SAM protein [Thermoanaerobaculia bacterium]